LDPDIRLGGITVIGFPISHGGINVICFPISHVYFFFGGGKLDGAMATFSPTWIRPWTKDVEFMGHKLHV